MRFVRALSRLPGRIQHLRIRTLRQETWFLARVFRLAARAGIRGIVAFSDPVPRHRAGKVIVPGHIGWTYQGHDTTHLGRTTAARQILRPDGTSLPGRAISKLTSGDVGSHGVAGPAPASGRTATRR